MVVALASSDVRTITICTKFVEAGKYCVQILMGHFKMSDLIEGHDTLHPWVEPNPLLSL